jgi:hypothetical protein
MKKIFEDKEFHSNVNFFNQCIVGSIANSSWTDSPAKFFVCDKSANYSTAFIQSFPSTPELETITGAKTLFTFEGKYDFTDIDTTQSIDIITGVQSVMRPNGNNEDYVTWYDWGGGGGYRPFSSVIQFKNTFVNTVKQIAGYEAIFQNELGNVMTVDNAYGYWYRLHKWGSGTVTYTRLIGFYSDLSDKNGNTTITNGWHFYGEGDFPSFFGGEIQQTEKDITASTPPTQAEMVSALGVASAHPDASLMVKVTDGSHFRVFSDGTNWYYSAYTVGA